MTQHSTTTQRLIAAAVASAMSLALITGYFAAPAPAQAASVHVSAQVIA